MKRLALLVVIGCGPGAAKPPDTPPPSKGDPIDAAIVRGKALVEEFFGEPLGQFDQHIFPRKEEMAAFALEKWQVPELPCWAVAMASGTTFVLLEPDAWATEACDHEDASDFPDVIAHELVHVFHGQHRPDDPEMNLFTDAGWFAEGLAVLASGQLDDERRAQARDAEPPVALAEAWSGPASYAIAGTLVELVDQRLGRDGLKALLPASTNAEILAALEMSEEELLEAWASRPLDAAGVAVDDDAVAVAE